MLRMHIELWLDNLKKRPPERLKRRWKDCIKMNLKEMGFEGVDWIRL
jgi:hypothetical protein